LSKDKPIHEKYDSNKNNGKPRTQTCLGIDHRAYRVY